MASLSPEQHIEAFLDEWQTTTLRVRDMLRAKDTSVLKDFVHLQEMPSANMVSGVGSRHLDDAATALLARQRLSWKLSRATARKALIEGFAAHLPKAQRTKWLSEHAIVAKATAALRAWRRDDGLYVFPVAFASRATTTDFCVGSARIVAKAVFEVEMADAWERHAAGDKEDGFGARLAGYWHQHSADFDHFITVYVTGYEEKMAWPAAREAAETLLNIVRMFFGYGAMDDVRIGDGFIWQNQRSALRLTRDQKICLSTSFGGGGSHLQDGWEKGFGEELSGYAPLLSMAVSIHTHHDGRPNPTFERLTYFDRLIAEAYCEPHHPIRLVRMVSALEAISMIGPTDKAHNLAHRCGCVGGWSDPHLYCTIYDAVREAYHWRNAVVHGDAPAEGDVVRAFHGLEKQILGIYLGMLWMHVEIAKVNRGRSVGTLRREFARRVDMFFWSPSLAT